MVSSKNHELTDHAPDDSGADKDILLGGTSNARIGGGRDALSAAAPTTPSLTRLTVMRHLVFCDSDNDRVVAGWIGIVSYACERIRRRS